jgi:adenylate cyclase class IV
MQEKEIKIKVNSDVFVRVLNDLTSRYTKNEILQEDEYYDTKALYLTNLCRGIRLRYHKDVPSKLEYKALFCNANGTRYVDEVPFELPMSSDSITKLSEILTRLKLPSIEQKEYESVPVMLGSIGLEAMIVVNKHRYEFESESVVFALDNIEGLGYFIEIEAKRSDIDPRSLLKDLLLPEDRYTEVEEGYNEMVARSIVHIYLINHLYSL